MLTSSNCASARLDLITPVDVIAPESIVPAKVAFNPDKVKAVATELPVENTKSVEFECDILDTSVPECLNIIASVLPEAPSSSNKAFPVVSILIPLALVVVIEPEKVPSPAIVHLC